MKRIFYLAACAVAILAAGCQKLTTEGVTGITYYATITLEGDSYMVVQKGDEFTDPGYGAVLNGQDVTDQVKVTTDLDVNKSGMYTISYSCTNADGFTSTANRTVVVLDLNDPIEGFYATDPDSHRINSAGTTTVYGASFEITVFNNGDGTYYVDDILGGYYCQRAGYGSNYACEGIITIASDGTVSLEDSYVPGWGDSADALSGTFDSATGTFDICTSYAGMDFYVTMTKE